MRAEKRVKEASVSIYEKFFQYKSGIGYFIRYIDGDT